MNLAENTSPSTSLNRNFGSMAAWCYLTRPKNLSVRLGTKHHGWRPFLFFRSRGLTSYMLLILRTYRQFNSFCWMNYDRAFREHSATEKLTDWSTMNVLLFNYHTAGFQVRSRLPLLNLTSRHRQRLQVTPPATLFATPGMLINASYSLVNVGSAMRVADASTIIVQLLVHLRSPLATTIRILRSQSIASAINCLCICC